MNWGYVAGYFDGEGNVYVAPRRTGGVVSEMRFNNNHEASLVAIRDFIAAGTIYSRPRPNPNWQQGYVLVISRTADVLRVSEALIPHTLVKRDALISLVAMCRYKLANRRTKLEIAGPDEIRRLYWDERLSQADVARHYGVEQAGVSDFMRRHNIPKRSASETQRLAAQKGWKNR